MAEVRIVAANGRIKRRFPSDIHPDDAVGADRLLRHWKDKLGLGDGATIEIHDKRCRCRRKYNTRD